MIQIGTWHSCVNNAHDIDVQTIHIDEWHLCHFIYTYEMINFAWLLLLNYGPWNLWCIDLSAMYQHLTGLKLNDLN
jgi:hypothetical protein